jgi:regulator of protease activity HflC (stomatin/prohibitin superfamily)
MNKQKLEKPVNATKGSGWIALVIGLGLIAFAISRLINMLSADSPESIIIGDVIFLMLSVFAAICCLISLTSLGPTSAKVYSFMGDYKGTLRGPGFYSVNFWWGCHSERDLSTQTLKIDPIKVNDKNGNPILIGCDVFCEEQNTYAATYDISDVDSYLSSKSEVALRALAMKYAMDSDKDDEHTLTKNLEEIRTALQSEVTKEFEKAGYTVDSVAITVLQYAQEIAGAMLQRQQAQAVISARKLIAEGALGIVKEAIDKMKNDAGVDLNEENKQKLASNLLITLCSHQPVAPVMEIRS